MKASEFDEMIAKKRLEADERARKEYYKTNQPRKSQPIKRTRQVQKSKPVKRPTLRQKPTRVKKSSLFKKVAGAVSYKKNLSSNLMRTFGGAQPPKIKKAPSRAQLIQQQKFAEMARRNAQSKKLRLPNLTPAKNRDVVVSGGQSPSDFRKPEARGVWAANPNSQIASKVPSNIPKYGRKMYFIEGDLMGNPVIREVK